MANMSGWLTLAELSLLAYNERIRFAFIVACLVSVLLVFFCTPVPVTTSQIVIKYTPLYHALQSTFGEA